MKNKRFVVAHAFGILMDVIANVTFVLFVSASVPIFLFNASSGLATDKISGALIMFFIGYSLFCCIYFIGIYLPYINKIL